MNALETFFVREMETELDRHRAMPEIGEGHNTFFTEKVKTLEPRLLQALIDEVALALADGACLHMAAYALEGVKKSIHDLNRALIEATVMALREPEEE